VNDAVLVRVFKRREQLPDQAQSDGGRYRAADPIRKHRAALDILHHQIGQPILLTWHNFCK